MTGSQKMYVFTGPTLSADDAREVLAADILPPVSQGDVYAAVRESPLAIGIIDGYFERVPAVWHKEILYALSRGVHVFGSASMGALRAAELEPFGMIGVGRVFDDYRSGAIEDDDEVVLVHGPAEAGYVQGSEPMVNIRATLHDAGSVIRPQTREALLDIAKALHYPQRTYGLILEQAHAAGLPSAELEALEGWLPTGKRDQKRDDAVEMLHQMGRIAENPRPKAANFTFQHTDAWEQVRRLIDRRPLNRETGSNTYQPGAVLDELRLNPNAYAEIQPLAMTRALALELAERESVAIGPSQLREVADAFRRENGLLQPEDMEQWMTKQRINPDELAHLLRDEARTRHMLALARSDVPTQLPDMLRLDGRYRDLEHRAARKEAVLASRGMTIPSLASAGLSEEELWRWFFSEMVGFPVPGDLDQYADELGFVSLDAFRQAVLREFCFQRCEADD